MIFFNYTSKEKWPCKQNGTTLTAPGTACPASAINPHNLNTTPEILEFDVSGKTKGNQIMYSSKYSSALLAPLSDDAIARRAPSVFATAKHESRSGRYTYIPTIDVVNALREVGYLPVSAYQSNSRTEGKEDFAKHMLRFRPAQAGQQLLSGQCEEVGEIVVINSHDGTSSYQISAGIFRLICQNGLMVGKTLQDYRIHHKGDIVNDVIDVAARVVSSHDEVARMVSTLKRIELKNSEQTDFAAKAIALRFDATDPTALPVDPYNMLRSRRFADVSSDLWTVFNRVQENAVKGGISARNATTGRYSTTRQVKGIDSLVRLNRGLWDLTIETAKVKGEI